MRSFRLFAVVLTLFACIEGIWAQPSPASQSAFPRVTIPGSEIRQLISKETGRNYDLYIHIPSSYSQDTTRKYPVLYILDGQWDFKLMDSVLGGLVYDKFVPEIIMVGITYSGDNPDYNTLRAMDFTPVPRTDPKGSGDAPKFLKFLKAELVPFIESNYRTDSSHRLLQGSSFGGLFTLYALFSDPAFFSGYIAASPAVPFAERDMFSREAEYARAHKELPAKLYLAVGGAEQLTDPVKEFMQILSSRKYKGLRLEMRVIDGERHAGNKPETFNRGLRFLFSN